MKVVLKYISSPSTITKHTCGGGLTLEVPSGSSSEEEEARYSCSTVPLSVVLVTGELLRL